MPAALLLTLLAAALPPAGALAPQSRPYDVGHYRLELRLQPDGTFEGRADIRLTPRRAAPALELDAFGLDVTDVRLADGGKLSFTLAEDAAARTGLLRVRPARPLPPGREATVQVTYRGRATAAQEGLFLVDVPGPSGSTRAFFTHLQPASARRLFPCNEQPGDEATSEVFAVVEARSHVVSNGRLLLDEAFSEGGRALRRVHWLQDQPHPPSRVALAVGPFETVEVPGKVPAALHLPAGTADRAFFARTATGHALTFQADFLGVKYPWARYDQVAVPHSLWDGTGATSLGLLRADRLLLDGGTRDFVNRPEQATHIARTLAHQWFGSLVGARGGGDRWLEDGLATYLADLTLVELLEGDHAEVARAERTFVTYLREEEGPRAHPLSPRAPGRVEGQDVVAATKGEMVARMLEVWLGREGLRKGLKAYLEAHAHGSATGEDFFAAVGRATGTEKELRAFRDSWLHRRGVPVLVPEMAYDGQTLTVTLTQRPQAPGEKGPFVFKLPVVFHREGSPSYHREEVILVDRPVVRARFALPAAPQWVNWNRDGAALVHLHTPAVAEQQWTRAARHDPDPVWRLLSAYALLGELVAPDAAELAPPTEAAQHALRELLERDPSPAVREAVLRRLGQARWKRLPGELGPTVLALARSPEDLPEDPVGRVRVRSAALALLGKLDFPEGHRYLLAHIGEPELDVNTLPGWTTGVARLGEQEALASLRAAVFGQKRRGEAAFRAAARSLGAFASPEVLPVLKEVLAAEEGNAELASALLEQLGDNHALLGRPELAAFVADFVVAPNAWGDDVRARMVRLLDTVQTPEARRALERIAASQAGDRLTGSARQVLRHNFPAEAPRPRTTSTRR